MMYLIVSLFITILIIGHLKERIIELEHRVGNLEVITRETT